jgi:hypothetical protein
VSMHRHLKLIAPFDVEDCGGGLWCLRQHATLEAAVYIRGSLPFAQLSKCEALGIDWLDQGGALVSMVLPSQTVTVQVKGAFVHEPRPNLYRELPLGRLDARTARFWRRVFGLVRLPGGQYLLGWLAARSRRPGT